MSRVLLMTQTFDVFTGICYGTDYHFYQLRLDSRSLLNLFSFILNRP